MPVLSTREKLIQAGHELFYREGFIAVGLDRVLSEVGCSKQTFYNHFESKDDLIVAVIEEHHRWWNAELQDRIQRAAGQDARAQIDALVGVVEEIMNDPEFRGCIYINAAVEFPQPHHPVHQLACQAKQEGVDMLHDMAERAGASDPRAFAEDLDMIIEGALITKQVAPHCDICSIARRTAQTIIDKYIPTEVELSTT